jgi:hypothetical protein
MIERLQRILLIVSIIICIILASCSHYQDAALDERFIDYFKLTDSIKEQAVSSTQTIKEEFVCGDYTIHVVQILGDIRTLYVAIDVIFPEDIDLKNLLQSSKKDEDALLNIKPSNISLFEGIIKYDEIEGMRFESIVNANPSKRYQASSGSELISIDFERNLISYIMYFSAQNSSFSQNELTMLINGFILSNNTEEVLLSQDIFAVYWKPKYYGQIYEWSINETDGTTVGAAFLSQLTLYIKLYCSEYQSSKELTDTLVITKKDGDPLRGPGRRFTSFSGSNGAAEITVLFYEIVSLDDIKSIQIDKYILDTSFSK